MIAAFLKWLLTPPNSRLRDFKVSVVPDSGVWYGIGYFSYGWGVEADEAKILIWSESLALLFGYFQEDSCKIQFLAGRLGTKLQFEFFISFHLNSPISWESSRKLLEAVVVQLLLVYFACGYSFFLTCTIFPIFFANNCLKKIFVEVLGF